MVSNLVFAVFLFFSFLVFFFFFFFFFAWAEFYCEAGVVPLNVMLVLGCFFLSLLLQLFAIDRLESYLHEEGPVAPILITSQPGCGKSILMAYW